MSREKPRQEKGTERKWDPVDLEEERRRNYENDRAVNTIAGKGVFRACLGELLDQAGWSRERTIKGRFSKIVQRLQ